MYDFRFKWTATAGIGVHPTKKPDCHSWWISKMQSDTLEERYAIKLCFKLGIYRIWFGWVLQHIKHSRLFNAKSSLYIYIKYIWFGLVWFGLVLWHINHCRLFNAKSSLYIYIKYIWFGLVWFYGISTILGYLMPNHLHTYILWFGLVWFYGISNIVGYLMPYPLHAYIKYMIFKHIFVDNIFKRTWTHFFAHS